MTIDTTALNATSAARLGALFNAAGQQARQGGAESEESILIGLAHAMAELVATRVADGESAPEPIELKPNAINLKDLSSRDCRRGAFVCRAMSERLAYEGCVSLASVFADFGVELLRVAEHKEPIATNGNAV